MESKEGVTPIMLDDMENLGIDQDNNLYWKGRRVSTEHKIGLKFWPLLYVIVIAGSAAVSALVALAEYFRG